MNPLGVLIIGLVIVGLFFYFDYLWYQPINFLIHETNWSWNGPEILNIIMLIVGILTIIPVFVVCIGGGLVGFVKTLD